MTDEVGNKSEHGMRSSVLEKITANIRNNNRHTQRPHKPRARVESVVDRVEHKDVKYVYRGYCKDILFHNFPEVRQAMDIFMESDEAVIFVEVQTQSAKIYLTNSAGDEVKMTMTGRVFVIE
jgi:hypothetical protein